MGLFSRKAKASFPSAGSAEHLSSPSEQQQQQQQHYEPQPRHPAHSSIDDIPSDWPAPSDREDIESKLKRPIFGRHSARDLGRSLSVRHHTSPSSPVGRRYRHGVEGSDQLQMHDSDLPLPRTARSSHPHPHPHPHPTAFIQRSNTDSSLDKSLNPYSRSDQLRPPSQQSLGPPSPFPLPDNMAERKDPLAYQRQEKDTPEGRTTPTKRDDEVDVRALVQKHDELQAKYSRVKRYYFEKDAQVQHLQNTVAHQRMAVSRTVLDDNEYASRFGRLDGAIKDLAFSVRKDWKNLPTWLHGYVNDDAHMVGTKEMTAVGRAVISRWVVEEVFQRHFHPALDPNLSMHLKSIEMNLRHQQVKTYTDEEKENAIARISNWRRTTFDGLGDTLQGKTAEDNRSQLIDNLIEKLVASLEMHLVEPPPAGLDTGARMIIENTVGIAEKIPLESRDVCVEYFHPGSGYNEGLMKIETSVPPLTNVKPEIRGSVDQDRDEVEDSSSSNSQDTSAASGHGPREKKKSVFSSLMKKTESARSSGKREAEEKEQASQAQAGQPAQIRFAAFVSAEVRGKGPTNILVKAPVYVIE